MGQNIRWVFPNPSLPLFASSPTRRVFDVNLRSRSRSGERDGRFPNKFHKQQNWTGKELGETGTKQESAKDRRDESRRGYERIQMRNSSIVMSHIQS